MREQYILFGENVSLPNKQSHKMFLETKCSAVASAFLLLDQLSTGKKNEINIWYARWLIRFPVQIRFRMGKGLCILREFCPRHST